MTMNRRSVLCTAAAFIAVGPANQFAIARVSPDSSAFRRREPPFSSPLSETFDPGTYHCVTCDLPLFASQAKYFTSTGWPTFSAHFTGTVWQDTAAASTSTIRCSRCGEHLGEAFADGPAPSGQRYCLNGNALRFAPRTR